MNSPEMPVIKALEGRELAGITFIRDYIQFLFDGPILNAYTLPRVITLDAAYDPVAAGYRDALCDQIGRTVTVANEEAAQKLLLRFNNGTTIEISLRNEDKVCAEAAMLQTDAKESWNVW